MKALVLPHYGSYQDLTLQDVPEPTCGPDEAIIKIHANGICFHDLIACRGDFPRTVTPGIIGHETAGEIVELGSAHPTLKVGDRVIVNMSQHCGHCSDCNRGQTNHWRNSEGLYGEAIPGGFAEFMAAKFISLIPIPASLTYAQGAIIPCPVGTAYHAIMQRAQLRPGEDVLITGATGGVGVHAVQIARMIGARVIAVTSSPAKAAMLTELGADDVIVSPKLDFAREARELTDGKGVDVILNIVGEVAWKSSLKAMAFRARHVFIGNVAPDPVSLRPAHAVLKEMSFLGTLGVSMSEIEELVRLVELGRITPVIESEVSLQAVPQILEQMEQKGLSGRIVLNPSL